MGNIVDNTDPANPVVTQEQSDWNQSDNTQVDYIKNKPVITTIDTTSLSNRIDTKISNITGLVTAGDNVTVTGTGTSGDPYVVNSSGTSVTTSEQVQIASGSLGVTFTDVPASYDDYLIFRNGVLNESTTDYTTSGNVVTFVSGGLVTGDRVVMRRTQ